MPLTVLDAFTWSGSAHSYITNIDGDVDDGGHGTIEVSLMDHPTSSYDYFLLVNRRCSSDNNGTPAPAQTIIVQTNKTGQYQIRDLYSGELFVSSDGYFRNITIGPGRGRLFELRPMFGSNETWTGTVNLSSSINVPSGRTLTIAPNTHVNCYTNTALDIYGILTAAGVHFDTSVLDNYWYGIVFHSGSSSSSISNSTIEHAIFGVLCNQSSPTIYQNTIQNNIYGVYCYSYCSPYINDNYIMENEYYGIYLTEICNPYIRHNEVSFNSEGGIACLNSSSPLLIGKSSSEPYGANRIFNNSTNHGVAAYSNSRPNLGTSSAGTYAGYSDIYNNSPKQVANYASKLIYARKNYWGTSKPGSYLFYGSVDYTYYLPSSSPYDGPTWGSKESIEPSLAEESINDEIAAQLEKAAAFEGNNQYEEAAAVYRYVVDNYTTSEYSGFALARLMACRASQGDITVERDYLAAIAQQYAKIEVGMSALLWQPLVEAHSKNDQVALAMCDDLVKTYMGTDLARDALFEKGTIQLYELNNMTAAQKTFDEFAQAYPDDPLVKHIEIILAPYVLPPKQLPKRTAQETETETKMAIPHQFALSQNYPNPFNPETEIRYQLPEAVHVNLSIYNLLGQKIRILIDQDLQAGFHSVKWDGKDDLGQPVPSGVYLFQLNVRSQGSKMHSFEACKKMILMK